MEDDHKTLEDDLNEIMGERGIICQVGHKQTPFVISGTAAVVDSYRVSIQRLVTISPHD